VTKSNHPTMDANDDGARGACHATEACVAVKAP
jgi:hypothetical protein